MEVFSKAMSAQAEFSWALQNLLHFPRLGIYYTLIPKNACTSVLNALIEAESGLADWFRGGTRIHNLHNHYRAFASQHVYRPNDQRLIVLRDPLARLASALTDKIFDPDPVHQHQHRFFKTTLGRTPSEWRISDLVRLIDTHPAWQIEAHFAPQSNFVFFADYTTVIDLSQPVHDIQIGDHRLPIGRLNASPSFTTYPVEDLTIAEIWARRRQGALPSRETLAAMIGGMARQRGNILADIAFHAEVRDRLGPTG